MSDAAGVDPLPAKDRRLEQLFFPDGSGFTINHDFRTHARAEYLKICKQAASREFVDENLKTGCCGICDREIPIDQMFCPACIAMAKAGKGAKK